MSSISDFIAEKIEDALSKERFRQWYENDYVNFIEMNENSKSKEEIIEDIQDIFDIDY